MTKKKEKLIVQLGRKDHFGQSQNNAKYERSISKYEAALAVFEGVNSKAALKKLTDEGVVFSQDGFREFASIGSDILYGRKDLISRLRTKIKNVREGRWSTKASPGSGIRNELEKLKLKYKELSLLYEACRYDNLVLTKLIEDERKKSRHG